FFVDDEQSYLFLLRGGPTDREPQTYPIPCTRQVLSEQVKEFVAQVSIDPSDPRAPSPADVLSKSRALFELLFPADARKEIEQAGTKRLLISPDDFLWTLPFAALVTQAQSSLCYLGLKWPLTYTQSLSLYVQACT